MPKNTLKPLKSALPPITQKSASEYTWTCEDCDGDVAPISHEIDGRIYYRRQMFCDCSTGQTMRLAHDIEVEENRREDEEIERQYTAHRYLQKGGLLTGKYRRFRFNTWDRSRSANADEAYTKILAYVMSVEDEGSNWLYLSGKYGLGKTHLAVAVAAMLAETKLWTPHVIVWPELCQATQESWSRDSGPTEAQMWHQARNAGVLVVDDLDKASTSDWAMGKLFGLINHRENREKVTIITANKSVLELRTLWSKSKLPHVQDAGMAILSRIQGQIYKAVEFSGDDQRMGV